MDEPTSQALRALLLQARVAALGTLHGARREDGRDVEPFVSMVPLAWIPGRGEAVIHVSALAPHTRDMLGHPAVSLMVTAPLREGDDPQALARATLQADALKLAAEAPEHDAAKAAYLAAFPLAEQTFALGDFSLFRLVPRSLRYVAGFGRAYAMGAEAFSRLMQDRADGAAIG